ncbi:serine/threonine-protein kinase WNK8-like [Chenopodium quinoa]|uniref:serine/threonine-protein kinase WNK8-like n=1 Tax=Chenopodium quinoa TaxID=63459 RepID=UPI000B774EFA|nr:serine/threonine-protein kinase WNK8-like [Chenopodium quinoa]
MAASRSRGGHDYTVWETDPTGKYTRYSKRIDEGDLKEVYLGYDKTNGRRVAWCKKFLRTYNLDTLITEAELLRNSNHHNIIKCFHYFWVQKKFELETKVEFNMITELYSGNLRDFTRNHQVKENSPAIKKWCRQILTGLDFLHSQNLPIIHNDLKCENIFVVGKSGTIKLGDLSAAKTLVLTSPGNDDARMIARSEVYCLGLCVLQMLTEVRLRTMDFILLNRIQDRQLRNFIQKCVYPADIRPTITQLLNDPFLLPRIAPSAGYSQVPPMPATSPPRAQPVLQPRSATDFVTEHRRFTLQGERIDEELMAVTLRTTEVKNTDFVFSLRTDTISSMMDVITAEVNTNADVELMSHTLERLRFYVANIELGGPQLDEPQEDSINEPLEINVGIEEQVREADGNVINNSNAAAENSEGDIDDSNTAAANSEGDINKSNIAAANSEGDIDDSNIDAANSEGDINNSNAAAANSEGDIDNSNAAAANSEGDINDSNIALSSEEA